MTTEITSLDEFNRIIKSPTIVKFYTDWCGPCKMYAKTFEHLAEKNAHISFVSVNAEKQRELTSKYRVRTVPYFVALNNSAIVEEWSGVDSEKMNRSIRLLTASEN